MEHRKKKLLFIMTGTIALVVLTLILTLSFLVKPPKAQVEAFASSILGLDVRIEGKASFALFRVLAYR
jgi:hypothetical protein